MTAEQLEELLWKLDNGHPLDAGRAIDELIYLAPELARKVIAAEKLAEAARKTVSPKTAMLSGLAPKISVDRLMWAGVDDLEKALAAWDSAQ